MPYVEHYQHGPTRGRTTSYNSVNRGRGGGSSRGRGRGSSRGRGRGGYRDNFQGESSRNYYRDRSSHQPNHREPHHEQGQGPHQSDRRVYHGQSDTRADRQHQPATSRGPQPRNEANADEDITTATLFRLICDRLDTLEQDRLPAHSAYEGHRHTDSNQNYDRREIQQPRRNLDTNQTRGLSHQPERSTNPDFALLVQSKFDYARTAHHIHNWNACPPSISRSIDNVVNNIHPPRPNSDVIEGLKDAAHQFKQSLSDVMVNHLQELQGKTKSTIRSLDQRDHLRATELAKQRLQHRFGNRINNPLVTAALQRTTVIDSTDDTLGWTRINRGGRTASSQRPLPTNIESANPFAPLMEQMEEALTEMEPSPSVIPPSQPSQTSPTTHPNNTKRRRLSEGSNGSDNAPMPPRFHIHKGGNADVQRTWSIRPVHKSHSTYIITDSNGRRWTDLQQELLPSTTIDVFPGLNLSKAASLLDQAPLALDSVQTIIVAVGINDRYCSDASSIITSFQRMKAMAERTGKRLVYSMVPRFQDLPTNINENIDQINELSLEIFSSDALPSAVNEVISRQPNDETGIHYDTHTARFIIERLPLN